MSSSLLSSKHSDLYIYNVQLEIYLICVPVGSPFSITSPVQITHSALQITNRQAYTFPCISYYMCKNEYIFQMHWVLLFVHVYVFSFRYTHIYVAFYCAVWLARLHQRISIYINLLVFCTHRILFIYFCHLLALVCHIQQLFVSLQLIRMCSMPLQQWWGQKHTQHIKTTTLLRKWICNYCSRRKCILVFLKTHHSNSEISLGR